MLSHEKNLPFPKRQATRDKQKRQRISIFLHSAAKRETLTTFHVPRHRPPAKLKKGKIRKTEIIAREKEFLIKISIQEVKESVNKSLTGTFHRFNNRRGDKVITFQV